MYLEIVYILVEDRTLDAKSEIYLARSWMEGLATDFEKLENGKSGAGTCGRKY